MNDHHALYLDDPVAPSFCPESKMYVGQKEDLMKVAGRLDERGAYDETARGIRDYFAGNTGVKHSIAYATMPVLTPVRVIGRSHFRIPAREWSHVNIWDCEYKMKTSGAEVDQILIELGKGLFRCVKAVFSDLCYSGSDGRRFPVGDVIFGHESIIETSQDDDGCRKLGTLLYVVEDIRGRDVDTESLMSDPDKLEFGHICDKKFGDG